MRFLAGNAAAVEHSGRLWMYVTQSKMSCKRGYDRTENARSTLAKAVFWRQINQIIQVERSVGRFERELEPLADSPVAVRTGLPFVRRTPRNLRSSLAGWCNEVPCPNARG